MIVVPEDTKYTMFRCLLSSLYKKWLWTPGTGSYFGDKMPLTAWVSLRKGSPLLLRRNKTLLSNTGLKNWCSIYSSTPNESLSLQPYDCSPPGSSINPPDKNIGMGCHSLLQGIFPTQGSNPGLYIAGRFFMIWATREAHHDKRHYK